MHIDISSWNSSLQAYGMNTCARKTPHTQQQQQSLRATRNGLAESREAAHLDKIRWQEPTTF
jgi:hypothetical protein